MKKVLNVLAVLVFTCAFASIAQAQASRTWVSGVGDDANPCSRTAPCKTWAGAISKTAPCGEIDALDPAGFGAVTITKSITLDGTGTMASILASLTTGVIINAGTNDVITLRGISINGFCNGIRGINVLSAKTVNIEDLVVFRFANEGMLVNDPNGVSINVRNTVFRDNAGDGVSLTAGAGAVKASFVNSSITGSGLNGLNARSRSQVNMRNSVVANTNGNGVFANATTAGTSSHVRIWASQISMNGGHGVAAGNTGNLGSSVLEIAQNQIDNNSANGVFIGAGGVVESFSNNSIRGNLTDGCTGCTAVGPGN